MLKTVDFKHFIIYNKSMEELKNVIASNLMNLRKANKLTQLELAEKLNYSDKAISKWERGESLPDILLLKSLADMYGVSVDYFMQEHSNEEAKQYKPKKDHLNNKLIITLLSCLVVWVCATILYVNMKLIFDNYYWMIWLWAIPVSSIVLIIFSSIWGTRKLVLASITLFTWSLITCSYLQFLKYNLWTIFLIGIPLQLAIILWSKIKPKEKNK